MADSQRGGLDGSFVEWMWWGEKVHRQAWRPSMNGYLNVGYHDIHNVQSKSHISKDAEPSTGTFPLSVSIDRSRAVSDYGGCSTPKRSRRTALRFVRFTFSSR